MTDTTVILGAGLAGLACGRILGDRAIVLEKDSRVGGTARSTQRDGFTFDVTGHWLHLATLEVRALVMELMGDELVSVQRRAEVHSHGVRTPYPFQANTYGLPPSVIADCVLGFFRAREAAGSAQEPKSFEEFIRQRMGDGIAEHFMIPYNTKLWTVPPSAMAHAWTGRFVPLPTAEEVVLGAVQPRGSGHALGYNSSFFYPKSGGIQTLAERLATSNVRTNTEVTQIDLENRRVQTRTGAAIPFARLVSTLPLTTLIDGLTSVPSSVREARSALASTSVTYWNLGFKGANRADDAHWIYFPEPNVPFYRAGSPSAALPTLAPPQHRSYYVEVAHRTGTKCTVDDAAILEGMRRVGLIAQDEDPVLIEHHTVPTAYVIMDMAYGDARAHIMSWLDAQGITSIGRYGAWMYDSMEGAIAQGLATGKRLLA